MTTKTILVGLGIVCLAISTVWFIKRRPKEEPLKGKILFEKFITSF